MLIHGLNDYDISSYKEPALFISFPKCTFKCGLPWCQNAHLQDSELLDISLPAIKEIYENSPLTHAFVCGGLEPFDTWSDLKALVSHVRTYSIDPIVIYTGYNEDEIKDNIDSLKEYKNIIIKFGRYVPNSFPHFDELLGVELASENQYAKNIS